MGRAKYSVNKRRNRKVPSSQRIPGEQGLRQKMNNAGGYAFKVDSWTHLRRFLILGSEAGTYYVGKSKLDKQCITTLVSCLHEDYIRTIDMIVEISSKGLAPKNDPAIFALAVACAMKKSPEVFSESNALSCAEYAREQLNKVCRIPSHLFSFMEYYLSVGGGWNTGMRKAVTYWYNKPIDKITMQMIKYQSREGWSNRDVLRLAHVKPRTNEHNALFRWAVAGKEHGVREVMTKVPGKGTKVRSYPGFETGDIPLQLQVFEAAKGLDIKSKSDREKLLAYITNYRLTHEMIPTEAKKYPEVWEALMQDMPLTALIRNLGNIGKAGLLALGSPNVSFVRNTLTNADNLKYARVHPLQIYNALKVYARGSSIKGSGTWMVNPAIAEALNEAFYLAFDYGLEPTGKRVLHSVDISGSMKGSYAGKDRLMSVQEGAAIMLLAATRQEAEFYPTVFHFDCFPVDIRKGMPIDVAVRNIIQAGSGGTAVSAPIAYALGNHFDSKSLGSEGYWYRNTTCYRNGPPLEVDAFVLYTDSETWADQCGHPQQLFDQYKREINPNAKAVVVSMTATDITVGDPKDSSVLQLCGFDTQVPGLIAGFLD